MNKELWQAMAAVAGFSWVGIAIANFGPGAYHILIMLIMGMALLLIGFYPEE